MASTGSLWKTVRTVQLWAALSPNERSQAFDAAAYSRRLERVTEDDVPEAIRPALAKAAGVLQPRARQASIAGVCRTLAEWSVEQGKLGSAIEFIQAAAMTAPVDAELAHEAARIARTDAQYLRAESWYRESISRARRTRDWHEFARSYIGMGIVFMLRGSFPQARKSLIRGLRAAKRFSLRPLVAAAYHELTALAIQAEREADVARYAQLAVEAYGPAHPRLPALVVDYGVFLMSGGYFAEALRILQTVPADFGRPIDRLLIAAAKVRTAGAVADRPSYAAAWDDAEALLADPSVSSGVAVALQSMAYGAAFLGESDRAEASAREVLRLAVARGESALEFVATGLLDSIRRHEPVRSDRTATPIAAPQIDRVVEELETAFAVAGSI